MKIQQIPNHQFRLFKTLICALILLVFSPILFISGQPKNTSGRFDFTSSQGKTEIPFIRINDHIVIAAKVNDQGPFNFILDSGSIQAMFFDKKMAVNLGIALGRKIQFSGVGCSNMVTGHQSLGVKLTLPGIEGNRMGMVVLNSDYMKFKRFGIHGVIGYQLFTRFAMKIDYQNNILTLMEPDQYNPGGFDRLDLQIDNSKPYVRSSIFTDQNSEIPLKLLVDTGSSSALFLMSSTHPSLQAPGDFQLQAVGMGLGGIVRGHKTLTLLKFGNSITRTPACVVESGNFSKKGIDDGKMGSIGNDILEKYLVIFDYVNSRLLIRHQPSRAPASLIAHAREN